MIDIYVPSYKRPNAPVIRKLISAGIPFTIVLDHEKDMEDYGGLQSEKTKIILLDKALGIGYVRQKIKERYRGVPVMMIDDDTIFTMRRFDEPTKLVTCNSDESVRKWFAIVDRFCRENRFDIGSVGDSVFCWNKTQKTLRTGSLASVTIFNSPRCHEIDYDPKLYKRMEDCDLILQAITKRFSFLRCNEVLRHCPMNKAAEDKGGCSEVYQNDAIMQQTTSYLIDKWGKDVVILHKTHKIGNFPDFKVDFRKVRKRYGYTY